MPESTYLPLTPDWAPFAAEIVGRWRASLSAKDSVYGREAVLTTPALIPVEPATGPVDAEGDIENDGEAPDDDTDDGILGEPEAEAEPRRQRTAASSVDHFLSIERRLLAIRVAATFGDRDSLLGCLNPGAVTVLTNITVADVKPLAELFWLGTLPPGARIGSVAGRLTRTCDVLLIRPDTDGGEISRFETRKFHERIGAALDGSMPVLILCPDDAVPEARLMQYLPAPLRLAPVDRSVILQLLRLGFPDHHKVDLETLFEALPDDHLFADVPLTALQIVFRAPGPVEAAERLRDVLRPAARQGGGPRLEDIAGDSEALRAARRIVADLVLWQQKTLPWNELCRSLLLFGIPGTGKTWLARAMGNSAGVSFVTASFAEWQSTGHLGDMLRAMRKSFADARNQAPAILFIDEIDAVGSREDRDRHNSSYRQQVINGFLEQMDSISREEGVIVIGACNYPGRIDPAVLRAGRFDLKIEIQPPDAEAILGILKHHLSEEFEDDTLRDLARAVVGSTSAEIDAAIRKARSDARGEGRALRLEDIRDQLGTSGPAGEGWDRRAAVHECGHAIVAAVLGTGTVVRVMLSRSGGTTSRQLNDNQSLIGDFEAELAYAMSGRAAERLVFGDVCAGSGGPEQSDLARATKMAVAIDTQLGLGVYGPLWIDVPAEDVLRDPEARNRVRVRLEAAEDRAELILGEQRAHLEAMAATLVHERELAGDALAAWLDPVRGR